MSEMNELIKLLGKLDTEKVNPNTTDIDRLSPLEIATKINAEDKSVAAVVETAIGPISKAADIFAETIRHNGRVFYIGAGTSGRLGVLDAAECPPTFGSDPAKIVGIISGGYETLTLSKVKPAADTKITMLGHGGPISWRIEEDRLLIDVPQLTIDRLPCLHAWTFKIPGAARVEQ